MTALLLLALLSSDCEKVLHNYRVCMTASVTKNEYTREDLIKAQIQCKKDLDQDAEKYQCRGKG